MDDSDENSGKGGTVEDKTSLTRQILKAYVDEEGLHSHLKKEGYAMMPVVKYVSYSDDGVLRLFCCGSCPGCPAPHIRNVCNIQFCDMVLFAIKDKFNGISSIVPVLTHDADFGRIAESHGGEVVYTCDRDTRQPYLVQKKLMLDWHPDIDCFIKIFKHRGVGPDYDASSVLSFEEAAETYNACFVINDDFKVNDIRGRLAYKEECFNNGFLLPEYTVESDERPSKFRVLMAYNKLFFRSSQYVAVVFK